MPRDPFGYHRPVGLADSSRAVLAGSPAFLNAVLPPLAEVLGIRPRIADAPHQVFALCQDGARVMVCEFRGQEWLPLVEDLKTAFGDELQILVAVPAERASASGPLAGAGADQVLPWDGRPDALVAAAARLAGLGAAAPSPAPQQAAAPAGPTPPRSPGPAVTPARPSPAVAPARPTPAVTPARPVPAVTPVRLSSAVQPAAAVPPALPAPTLTPVRPVAAPPPLPRPEAPPPLAVDAGAVLAARYFADLETEDGPRFSIVEAPPDAAARWGDAELVAFERSGTWPGTVLASCDAEGLLAGALAGFWPERADLKAHTERVVAELSPLERDAIAGRPVPADPAPVSRAAALRWQVSAALSTAPPPGSPVDAAAVRAILAEIDAVLADLKQASQGAPAEALPGLDQLRRALVAEAVDLTEAVHRIAPQEASPAVAARETPQLATRLLSNRPEAAASPPTRRQASLWVVLALALLGAVAYHGYRYANRRNPPQAQLVPGAPAGAVAGPELPGGGRMVILPPGAAGQPAVERFRKEQELNGSTVRVESGAMVVTPRGAPPATEGRP